MRWIALAALLAALVACKKKEAPRPPGPPPAPAGQQTAAPAAVLARGEILGSGIAGSVDALVGAVEPYLAAMGASTLTLAGIKATLGRWIGLASWDGVDGDRPIRVWLLNPKKYKPPLLVALPVSPAAAKPIETRGWATERIGDHVLMAKLPATLAALRPVATAALAQPAGISGASVRFELSLPDLLATYEPEMQKALGKVSQALSGSKAVGEQIQRLVAWEARGFLDIARQIERADAEISVGKDHARLVLRLRPAAGTGLGELLAAPAEALPDGAARLPANAALGLVFGYSPAALSRAVERVVAHAESLGPESPTLFTKIAREALLPFVASLRGDWSYARRASDGATVHYVGVRDGARALDAMRTLLAKASDVLGAASGPLGVQGKATYRKDVGKHKGISFDRQRIEFDFSKMPDFQAKLMAAVIGKRSDTYVALARDHLVMVTGTRKALAEALDRLAASGPALAEKAEYRELAGQLPKSRFLSFYFSFVDYLKSTLGRGGGKLKGLFGELQSRGYIGGGLSVEGSALRLDAIATRSQIESIKKVFEAMKTSLPKESPPRESSPKP